jgi:hypothetical protein
MIRTRNYCRTMSTRACTARGIVEWMRLTALGHLAPIVSEQMRLEAVERHGLEEPRGHDAVRVDVVAGSTIAEPVTEVMRAPLMTPDSSAARRRLRPQSPRPRPSPGSSAACVPSGCPGGP